ncbi:MAG: discoidin domain-containing protein [Saprospiraceae bacterium]|nr:discoidin domain-containing protein [Saprospiraceae bacterium]
MSVRYPIAVAAVLTLVFFSACLPPSDPYPYRPANEVLAEAQDWSDRFEGYIEQWLDGQAPAAIPDSLIPQGISDSKDFYLKNPDLVTPEETWGIREARPINKDSLYTGIPDPKITYLFLGTALAPFGSKLVMEGEFPHCRFFSVQITAPLNGLEYYAQRQFGAAEVAVVDADIEPLPGHTNPFRPGADRTATRRSYRLVFNLRTGDPTALNPQAHRYPYRAAGNERNGAMLVCQGPLGFKTVAGTDLPVQGHWNLGALWVRIYEPDNGSGPYGGVSLPRVWFELPDGRRYFVGSDFSALQERADKTIANRTTDDPENPNFGPAHGWSKSWEISRSILSGICQANGWSRPDSGARVRDIALGWTGRGEFQPFPSASIEPHATTNNYISYLGRALTVRPGHVAVLTGRMPTFPSTRNGEPVMQGGEVRYWSICGIDQDPLSPLPATTVHAVSDADVTLDSRRNYIIAYSSPADRPANATPDNGVTWVDWGEQRYLGLLMRWLCVAPDWHFPLAPHENNLGWARAEWTGSAYDSTLIGVNWRNGYMQCYLPKVHYLTTAEFEALGANLRAEQIPVWVDASAAIGPSEGLLGTATAASVLDITPVNAPANAHDGNPATAWSSAFGQQQTWITLDLGATKVISAVKLHWDWIFFARDYTIQVSDDNQTWTDIGAATNANGQIDLFKNLQNIKARYVRLSLTRYNAGYYRLGEMEVFTNDCDCAAGGGPSRTNNPAPATVALRIWPNPASGGRLWMSTPDGTAVRRIRVFDVQGREQPCTWDGHEALSLPNAEPGAYLLQALLADGREGYARFLMIE